MRPNALNREQFLAATGDAQWATVDDLVARLDRIDFWTEEFIESSLEARKKAYVRKEMRAIKDEDGWPLFASVTTTDPESGDERRIYKQEAMFDRDDYMHVVRFHRERADYHRDMAMEYAARATKRFDMQLTLDAVVHESLRS